MAVRSGATLYARGPPGAALNLLFLAFALVGCGPAPPPRHFGCLAERDGACLPGPEGVFASVPAEPGEVRARLDTESCPTVTLTATPAGTEVHAPACDAARALTIETDEARWELPLRVDAGGASGAEWRAWAQSREPRTALAGLARASVVHEWEDLRAITRARLELRAAGMLPTEPERDAAFLRAASAVVEAWERANALGHAREAGIAADLGVFLSEHAVDALEPMPTDLARTLPELRRAIRDISASADVDPAYFAAFCRALVERREGRPDSAIAELDAARALAEEFPSAGNADDGGQLRADLLAAVGRRGEALAWHATNLERRLTSANPDPWAVSEAVEATLWVQLGAREAGWTDAMLAQVLPAGLDVSALVERRPGGCTERANVNPCVNRAVALLQEGRIAEADAVLAALRPGMTDETLRAEERAWYLLAEGRSALAHGDAPAAEAWFVALLAADGPQLVRQDIAWRAELGLADAALARGDPTTALGRFEAAHARYLEMTLWVPVTIGRDVVMREWATTARAYVHLLLDLGRTADAFAVFRELRRAPLLGAWTARRTAAAPEWASLQDRWYTLRAREAALAQAAEEAPTAEADQLATERARLRGDGLRLLDGGATHASAGWSLRSAGPGELYLGWMELDEGGGVTFAADDRQVVAVRSEAPPSNLETLAPTLRRADLLLFLPFDGWPERPAELVNASGAALPWVVAADLPPGPRSPPQERVIVVQDPTGSSPTAAAEMDRVRAWARSAGRATRAEARIDGLRASLPGARAFHFAGHLGHMAVADLASGWVDSGLLLDTSPRLVWTPADTLLLPGPAPRWTYLSACATAADSPHAGGSIGVAQAFLVSGSSLVVATTRDVRPDDALAVARGFYAAGGFSDTVRETAGRLRGSLLELSQVGGDADAFQLLVP